MQHKTQTTLGKLRTGDRFVFPGKKDVWQVTSNDGGSSVCFNQLSPQGQRLHKWDEMKKANTQVIFLRHTVPAPGEECTLGELAKGDVFYFPWDIINEYTITKVEGENIECFGIVGVKQRHENYPPGAKVILIRKAEEVKV